MKTNHILVDLNYTSMSNPFFKRVSQIVLLYITYINLLTKNYYSVTPVTWCYCVSLFGGLVGPASRGGVDRKLEVFGSDALEGLSAELMPAASNRL